METDSPKPHTCGGYHEGKARIAFLKKLKMDLPYDPEIPLLGIHPEKNMVQKDTCTPMFTAALFTIAKTWK